MNIQRAALQGERAALVLERMKLSLKIKEFLDVVKDKSARVNLDKLESIDVKGIANFGQYALDLLPQYTEICDKILAIDKELE
ncbi:MAG: hypothetical protein HQK89_17790 [Nitrospirae bacterium]|nr:hypothetical protein [Nitrospirota bacterium]